MKRMGREQSAMVSEFRNAVKMAGRGGRNMKSVHHIWGRGFKSMEVLLAISVVAVYVVLLVMPVITVYVDGSFSL